MKGEGDCFFKNGQTFIDNEDIYEYLCHGMVVGQGKIKGIKHRHCWIETGDIVFDFSNGKEVVMRKEQYYKIGKITDVKRYKIKEVLKQMVKTEHWGSWE